MTSRYTRLTPNQPVSAIPPRCQKSLEAGALMWPAAKRAPRSAVHGWTRPIYLWGKKGKRHISELSSQYWHTTAYQKYLPDLPSVIKHLSALLPLCPLPSFWFLSRFYLCDDSRSDLQGLNGGSLSDQRHRSLHSNWVTCWFCGIGGDSCWESAFTYLINMNFGQVF